MATTLRRLWKNEYFKTAITIALIPILVGGFWFGLQAALNTDIFPLFTVTSNSMCIPPGPCDTFSHTFERTLHVGDLLVIQGVNAEDLKTDYPNSDIIVYKKPADPTGTPIVHRIVASYVENGTLYFQTKGDGNGEEWPSVPSPSQYDSNSVYAGNGQGVPADLVEGKVIMRIPLLGWITLFFRYVSWGLPLVVVIILLLVILEFVLPVIKRKPQPSSEFAINI